MFKINFFKSDTMEEKEEKENNLPIAAFTFGKSGQHLVYSPIPDLSEKKNESIKKNNNNFINSSVESKGSKDSSKFYNERFSFKNIINKNNKKRENKDFNNNNLNNYNDKNNNFVFIDKEDSNSSYIKVILYALSYMPLFSNYIINEIQFLNDNNQNMKEILLIISDILLKIDHIKNSNNMNKNIYINNIINIEQLKEILSETFKKENKFLKKSPDDPIDFLYTIINNLHELNISNRPIKKICDECFSHKNLSITLYKLYECECKAQSNLYLSINNYFIDIPINIIIKKFGKMSLTNMNQMLFNYYQKLIYNIKIKGSCPKYGKNCQLNKVHKKYVLKRCPSYLIFNLENDLFKNNELFFSLGNILKNFVLIPHMLNINTLFNLKKKNDKIYYELIGIIFLKISKIYSCIFKSKDIFYYYEDNIFLCFDNYYDIILFSLKNGNIPIAIFYQNIDLNLDQKNIDKNSISFNTNYELTADQINKLEKYVKNINNLSQNMKNKIRTDENILSDFNINYEILTPKNPSFSDNYTSSRYSNSVNSYNSYQKNEYICNHCERINKIENNICMFCGFDNKRFNDNINNNIINNKANSNNNVRKLKNNIIIKRKIILKREKNPINQNNKNKESLDQINNEFKNITPQVLKYFDMPKPHIPIKKEIKSNSSQKQKFKSNRKLHNSPKLSNNSYINRTDQKSFKTLNKSLKKKYINNTNRNKKINNTEFYTDNNEPYNNQLNINLKINNNNNYNIFEFGGKNKLIKLNDYSTEENYFNKNKSNKILKKISDIKNLSKNKIINYNLLNNTWVCLYCFNENENDSMKCIYCQKERNINNINKSPKNKSKILNENRINFNNVLIGQMSTKNRNIINKI